MEKNSHLLLYARITRTVLSDATEIGVSLGFTRQSPRDYLAEVGSMHI